MKQVFLHDSERTTKLCLFTRENLCKHCCKDNQQSLCQYMLPKCRKITRQHRHVTAISLHFTAVNCQQLCTEPSSAPTTVRCPQRENSCPRSIQLWNSAASMPTDCTVNSLVVFCFGLEHWTQGRNNVFSQI